MGMSGDDDKTRNVNRVLVKRLRSIRSDIEDLDSAVDAMFYDHRWRLASEGIDGIMYILDRIISDVSEI